MEWREWRLTHQLARRAYVLGVIAGRGLSSTGHGWRLFHIRFRGKRPYVLGLKREKWGYPWHLIRYRHWPGPIVWGFCGKCAPWPCCGATGLDHAEDCEADL